MITSHTFHISGNRLDGGVAASRDSKAVVVLCHGVPSGMPDAPGDRGYPGLAADLAGHGFEVWWFDFRGARNSEGMFTYGGWIDDLHGVLKEVRRDETDIYVIGSSAGGAVALLAAAESTSIRGIATLATPAFWTRGPLQSGDNLFEHAKRIGLVPRDFARDALGEEAWWAEFETNRPEFAVTLLAGRPLLVLQGTEDPVVDPHHAQRLFDNAVEPKEMVMLEGAGHQLRRDPRVVPLLAGWLTRVTYVSRR